LTSRIRYQLVGAIGAAAVAATGLLGVAAAAPSHPNLPAAHGVKVSLRHTAHGRVLVGPNGHSLYIFTSDSRNHSHCKGACRAEWPPLMSKHAPRAGTGVKAAKLGRTRRGQVTYYGHPLYYFFRDDRAGQTRGEDLFRFNGYWYLINRRGHAVV
jgi:predicted lipoprotein with Yx(FWY)xxD motif